MTDNEMEEMLIDAIEIMDQENEENERGKRGQDITTFEQAGILTKNRGLVVGTEDGSEFQITIVKSR